MIINKIRKLLFTSNSLAPCGRWVKKQSAFTLTEVLLAILIVGIIAALVLPAVVTKYQESALENAYTREVKSIEDSILSLAVNENKTSFKDTMMYKENAPESYADNAEKYMKKYLRVSKYCGENTGSGCFAKKYYEYKNNDKVEYTPEYKGACGVLKNGTSICITPQVAFSSSINGLMDLNGPKGPNVLGKDLRGFSIALQTWHTSNASSEKVIALDNTPIGTTEPDPCAGLTCGCGDLPACGGGGGGGETDPCETNPKSLACCQKSFNKTNCCSLSAYVNDSRCSTTCKITVGFNKTSSGGQTTATATATMEDSTPCKTAGDVTVNVSGKVYSAQSDGECYKLYHSSEQSISGKTTVRAGDKYKSFSLGKYTSGYGAGLTCTMVYKNVKIEVSGDGVKGGSRDTTISQCEGSSTQGITFNVNE